MSIFSIQDIDKVFIENLEIDIMRIVYRINKYYRDLIKPFLEPFINFYKSIPKWSSGTSTTFEKAIKYGNLNICKYLHKKFNYDMHYKNELVFRVACAYGHIDIAKWIYSLGDINIHANNEGAFCVACSTGNIEIVQWLFTLGNINIHANNEDAFSSACINGHLKVAKWLFSLDNINYRVDNDNIFKESCRYQKFEIGAWLCLIEPKYSFEIIDSYIHGKYIRYHIEQ